VRKKFLINIIFLIGLNLLIKPFWILGIDREIQKIVGNEEYGLYFALFGFTFIFQILLDLGITNYNNQSIAKNHNFLADNFAKLGGLKFGLAGVYLIITILASYTMGYSEKAVHLLYFLAFNQLLLSFILFLRSNISGLQIFWLDSFFSVLDRLLLIGICSYLILDNSNFQIEWLAYSQATAYGITFLICLSVVIFKAKSFFKIPSINFIKGILIKSFPFAVIVFFMTMYYRADAVMIERLLPDGEYKAGLYAQGYRFFDLLNNFVYLFTGILFPLLTKEISIGKSIGQLVTFVIKFLSVSFLFVIGVSLFITPEIIEISYSEINRDSSTVLTILLITFIPMVFSSIYGTVVTAGNKLKEMIICSGIAFGTNIILNFMLIPIYGIIGAAIASFIAQLIMAIGCYIIAGKSFDTYINMKNWIMLIAPIIITMCGISYFQNSLNSIQIISILITFSVFLLLLFFYKSYNEFKVIQNLTSSK